MNRPILQTIGLGGGCHWCTEAVFQSLKGVFNVEQGYIASDFRAPTFSEGILIDFDDTIIPLEILIEIHLLTHKSTSQHSMRNKYRSAVYYFNANQKYSIDGTLTMLQRGFENTIVTKSFPFNSFESSRNEIKDYFYSNPEKPFCKMYIQPKLNLLLKNYSKFVDDKHSKPLINL